MRPVEGGPVAVPKIRRIDVHAPKFQYFERRAVDANSFLTKEDGAR